MSDFQCPECGGELELIDTTYCNYNSPRANKGQHTGDIYGCQNDGCGAFWLDSYLRPDNPLEPWFY